VNINQVLGADEVADLAFLSKSNPNSCLFNKCVACTKLQNNYRYYYQAIVLFEKGIILNSVG